MEPGDLASPATSGAMTTPPNVDSPLPDSGTMPTPDLLAFPVAALDTTWFETYCVVELNRLLSTDLVGGGVLWLPVDSSDEADFILSRVKGLLRPSRHIEEFSVAPEDPLLCWADLFGNEHVGHLGRVPQSTIVLLYGGQMLSAESVEMHYSTLQRLARGAEVVVVFPVFPISRTRLSGALSVRVELEIPSLAATDPHRTRMLAAQLVASAFPASPSVDIERAADWIVTAKPKSRSQVQHWIDVAAAASTNTGPTPGVGALLSLQLPLPSDPQAIPTWCPTRDELRRRWQACLDELAKANAKLVALANCSLCFDFQPLTDPFESRDPTSWLAALVSHVSCIVLDAGRLGLTIVGKFQYDSTRRDVVSRDASHGLLEILRPLRTSMQHAMDVRRRHSEEMLASVKGWYNENCGTANPDRRHARRAAHAFMRLWETYVANVMDVITHGSVSPNWCVVVDALCLGARALSPDDYHAVVQEVIEQIDSDVDAEKFARRYQQKIVTEVESCALTGHALRAKASEVVARYVASESSMCPVDGKWLADRGVPPGKLMGRLLKELTAKWEEMQIPDVAAFVAAAEVEVQRQASVLSSEGEPPSAG